MLKFFIQYFIIIEKKTIKQCVCVVSEKYCSNEKSKAVSFIWIQLDTNQRLDAKNVLKNCQTSLHSVHCTNLLQFDVKNVPTALDQFFFLGKTKIFLSTAVKILTKKDLKKISILLDFSSINFSQINFGGRTLSVSSGIIWIRKKKAVFYSIMQ